MKVLHALRAVVLAGVLAVSPVHAQTEDTLARVNGVRIPRAMADLLIRNAVDQGQADTPELRTRIREVIINQELVRQEAVRTGLDKGPDVDSQILINRQQILINAYMQDYLRANPITEELMRAEYEKATSQMGNREYKARHILVKQEEDAKQIIAQLQKGSRFEDLAARSEDAGSRANGGDLGWNAPNRYVQPFADALLKLARGQLTAAPVQTQFGWHVIRLDDERPASVPSFESTRDSIQQQLYQLALQKVIAELRAAAKIE